MITTKFENFLLPEDLIFFENSPEVAIEKNRLENMNKVYFSLTLPNSIKQSLSEKFGLDLTGITKFPMTWIKGDTPHHIDVGSSSFTKTHLLYLNDNPGEFIVNDEPYPITKNTAYVFSEGLAHKTINTGAEPRLLLGPMNEFAHPVGFNYYITYYSSQANALNNANPIAYSYLYTVEIKRGILSWRIASNSTGSSSTSIVYKEYDVLNDDGIYHLYADPEAVGSLTYYPTEADALATTNSIGSDATLRIGFVGGYGEWRLASNSTGTSSTFSSNPNGIYNDLYELNYDGDYYAYPVFYITYYSTEADAFAETNPIGAGINLTVETTSGYSSFRIASNSTGTSSQLSVYVTGNVLNDDGNYYLYPSVVNSVTYYPTQADALAGTNSIGTGASLTVETIGGFSSWRIVSNSTGSSDQIDIYSTGDVLNDDGNYNLYPLFSVSYYLTQSDALAGTNAQTTYASLLLVGGPWRIASNSTGSSSQLIVYVQDDILNDDGNYNLYPAGQLPCFLEGTTILCKVDDVESYLPIETIKPGTLVKTSLNGYKKVELIGKGTINNPGSNERIEKRLYKCSTNKYAELKEDLYITGCHSILVNNITDLQREQTIRQSGKVFVTDKKYRLMACIDERAEPWVAEGTYTIWHVALENNDIKMNYGVYANGGLLVETCSINYMRTKANMQLIA